METYWEGGRVGWCYDPNSLDLGSAHLHPGHYRYRAKNVFQFEFDSRRLHLLNIPRIMTLRTTVAFRELPRLLQARHWFKLGYNRFLPQPFQFIIPQWTYHWRLYSCCVSCFGGQLLYKLLKWAILGNMWFGCFQKTINYYFIRNLRIDTADLQTEYLSK
jgi:hypothetical protein